MPTYYPNLYVSYGTTPDGHTGGWGSDAHILGEELNIVDDNALAEGSDEITAGQPPALEVILPSIGAPGSPAIDIYQAVFAVNEATQYDVYVIHIQIPDGSGGMDDVLVMGVIGGGSIPEIENGGGGQFFGVTDIEGTSGVEICFAAGTEISVPGGTCKVEELSIGDTVMTVEGASVPVKWIGRQTVMTAFRPVERLSLVRFAAGGLGDDVPQSDLTVTADHAMLIDGVLCHAGALINGTTITDVPRTETGLSYTVFHIETDAHEIILANGAPAETFIDNVSRRVFDNYDEFEALYGDVPEMEELDYPRAMSARQVPPAIKAKLGIAKVA